MTLPIRVADTAWFRSPAARSTWRPHAGECSSPRRCSSRACGQGDSVFWNQQGVEGRIASKRSEQRIVVKGVRRAQLEQAPGARVPQQSDRLFAPAEASGDVGPGQDLLTSNMWGPQWPVALCRRMPSTLSAWAVSASSTAIRPIASNLASVSASLRSSPLERFPLARRAAEQPIRPGDILLALPISGR